MSFWGFPHHWTQPCEGPANMFLEYPKKRRADDRCKQNDPVFSQTKITYIPMFLGGVMKACGNTAPLYIKSWSP